MKRLTTKDILALWRADIKALPDDAVIATAKLLENYHEQRQKEDFVSALGPERDCSLHGTACHGAWCATREGIV